MNSVRNTINNNLQKGLKQAVTAGTIKAGKICEDLASGDISPMTWKAICKRGGSFRNKKKVPYDWNEAFSEPFLSPLAVPWNFVFSTKMTELHAYFSVKAIESLGEFVRNLKASIAPICGPSYKPLQDILAQVPYLEDQIRTKVAESLKMSKDSAQAIHYDIGPIVQEGMQSVYDACLAEKGRLYLVV
jgi:hypothetical protein